MNLDGPLLTDSPQVALRYAGRHGTRVAGLLLVDPNGDQSRIPEDERRRIQTVLRLFTGDDLLSITAVRPGSVVLTLEVSRAGSEMEIPLNLAEQSKTTRSFFFTAW